MKSLLSGYHRAPADLNGKSRKAPQGCQGEPAVRSTEDSGSWPAEGGPRDTGNSTTA
ncbi:Hypothetical predicted protein, partial [Marmota monax]